MVQQMYNEQGQQITGLLTEEELYQLEHHKSLNQKDFLERSYKYNQIKEEKILRKQMEAFNKDEPECTF